MYKTFEEWFHEIEGYGLRSERFHEEFSGMTTSRAIEWMRYSWECSRDNDIKRRFEEESG